MKIKTYPVHPALKEFVEMIFHFSAVAGHDQEIYQTSLPSHECFLSFEYDTDFLVKGHENASFVPIYNNTVIPPQLGKTEMKGRIMKAVMVKFKNGGFFRLFKIPISEFNNVCFNASSVFGKPFVELHEQMNNVETTDGKVKFLEQFLIKSAMTSRPCLPMDHMAEKLLMNKGNITVKDLASSACMSIRQLERKFLEQFGMSPKCYSRLIRFTSAHRMRTLFPRLTWGEISIRCGYFDQMHLIHDFKSIAALNPCQLDAHVSESDLLLLPATEIYT
jgi:AraC-like DNA-binding protein